MKKTLSLFLILLVVSSSAYSATSLKEALSAYRYSVEVEWDQKNPEMLKHYEDRLHEDLNGLMQNQTPDVLMEEALALTTSAQAEEAKLLVSSLSSGKIQKEEFEQKMLNLYETSRMKGASWNAVTILAVGSVTVLAISYLAIRIYMYEWGKRF